MDLGGRHGREDQGDLLRGVDGDRRGEHDADGERESQYGLVADLVHLDAHLSYRLQAHLVPGVEALALGDHVSGLGIDGAQLTPDQGVHAVPGPEERGEVGHEVEAEGAELRGEVADVRGGHDVLPEVAQEPGHVGRRRLHDDDGRGSGKDHPPAGYVRCPPAAHGLHARCLRSQA